MNYDERIHSDFRSDQTSIPVDVFPLADLLPKVTTEVVGHITVVTDWAEDQELPAL